LLRANFYFGDRQVRQYQSIPVPSGASAANINTYAGGVVDLERNFGGSSLNWIHDGDMLGRPLSVTTGLEHEILHERRRGYDNIAGTLGALRRDEDDSVTSTNLFTQADWRFDERASATLGARATRVAFSSKDYFITGANPDDSGSIAFTNTSPVAGITYRVAPEMNLYAAAGRGFETPTFAELAYRSGGATGLNFDLKPSRSTNYEVGLKGRIAGHQRVTLARFETATRDEITVDTNSGGRSTFKNAGRTRRTGWETSWQAILPAGFDAHVAYTLLDARYEESFTSTTVTVPAGNRIPGIPRTSLYAELRWRHPSGFFAAIEARHNSQVFVDDQNSDAAAAYSIANLRAGFEQKAAGWRISETWRADNLADRNYIGSVIVADSNGRFFEPAPRRNFSFIVSGQLPF
jgi:iron complex outermembrane receptor protein